jgi:hypothetical protein
MREEVDELAGAASFLKTSTAISRVDRSPD